MRAAVVGLAPMKVVRLPATTLRPGSQNEVMVVKEGARLEARRVTFTRAADGQLLVRAGLKADERVLLSPSPEAQDGDAVKLAEGTSR